MSLYFRLVICCLSLLVASAGSAQQNPNVLFISIDDLNDWAIGGHVEDVAPNIDRLASQGFTFGNAQTPSPACNPSRTAVLTGISPLSSGIQLNSQHPFRDYGLTSAVSLPQFFKDHGYRIVGGGKVFHSGKDLPYTEWDDYPDIRGTRLPDAERIPLNGIAGIDVNGDGVPLIATLDWGPLEAEGQPDLTTSTREWNRAQWAVSEILDDSTQPKFVALGFFRPHLPWYAPRKFFERIPWNVDLPLTQVDDLADVPTPLGNDFAHRDIVAAGAWQSAVRAYLANIAFVDEMLGEVLDAVEASIEPWIVLLWSDHGFQLGEKRRWTKGVLWEESTRSVLMIAGPGISPGGSTDLAVGLIDIYPTLTDLAGLPMNPAVEGRSLRRFTDQAGGAAPDSPVVSSHVDHLSLRSRQWKYIVNADGTEELYDHDSDPNEWFNLAPDSQHDDLKEWLLPEPSGGLLAGILWLGGLWLRDRNARISQ